jgi:hypothetical protein
LIGAGIALLGLAGAAAIFLAMFQPGKVPRKADPRLSPSDVLQQQVDQLLADGVVTKAEGRAIWIERVLWRMRNQDEKKAIATTCGTLAGLKDGSKKAWCEIRDNSTGKIIAKWSEASGLEALEH